MSRVPSQCAVDGAATDERMFLTDMSSSHIILESLPEFNQS